jgi:hypothetical protein
LDWEFKDKIEYNISSEENSLSINEVTDKPFTVTEINKCIKKLKTGKSTGFEQFPILFWVCISKSRKFIK